MTIPIQILPVFSSSTEWWSHTHTYTERNDCCCYYLMHSLFQCFTQQFHRINNFNGTDTCVYEIGLSLFVATYQQITRQLWLVGCLTTESKSDEKTLKKNRVENSEEKRVERCDVFVLCFSMKINSVFNELHLNEKRQCWEDTRELAIMSSFLRFMSAFTRQHAPLTYCVYKNTRDRYEIDARAMRSMFHIVWL